MTKSDPPMKRAGASRPGRTRSAVTARRRFAALLCLCLAGAACAPAPGPAPDAAASPLQRRATDEAAAGRSYAQAHCASCHAILAGAAPSPNLKAPSFAAVANTHGMTRTALNVWLHTSHPTMPNLIIDPDRIGDVSAYIATLKTNEPDPAGTR